MLGIHICRGGQSIVTVRSEQASGGNFTISSYLVISSPFAFLHFKTFYMGPLQFVLWIKFLEMPIISCPATNHLWLNL